MSYSRSCRPQVKVVFFASLLFLARPSSAGMLEWSCWKGDEVAFKSGRQIVGIKKESECKDLADELFADLGCTVTNMTCKEPWGSGAEFFDCQGESPNCSLPKGSDANGESICSSDTKKVTPPALKAWKEWGSGIVSGKLSRSGFLKIPYTRGKNFLCQSSPPAAAGTGKSGSSGAGAR